MPLKDCNQDLNVGASETPRRTAIQAKDSATFITYSPCQMIICVSDEQSHVNDTEQSGYRHMIKPSKQQYEIGGISGGSIIAKRGGSVPVSHSNGEIGTL